MSRIDGLTLSFIAFFAGCLDSQRARVTTLDDVGDVVDARPAPGEDVADATSAADTAPPDSAGADAAQQDVGFFGGGWLIDQPMHALYEASFYRLQPDGLVELVVSTPEGCTGHLERFCETGHISPAGGDTLCRFGGARWREVSERVVSLVSACDDGVEREILLDFADFDPAAGGVPIIREVDGERGWRHASWDWYFRRCEADLQFGFEPVRCQ